MCCIGVYTVGSCWCQHCIFNVAECNLGKVKLETMLASCLSLEFTGVAMGLSQGHLGFYGYLIDVISFLSCYMLWYIMCLFLLPSQSSFGKYWLSIFSFHWLAVWWCMGGCHSQCCRGYPLHLAAVLGTISFSGTSPALFFCWWV